MEHGSEDEAATLLEEIKALNHKIAAHTAADTATKVRKHLDRVTTVRETLWRRLVDAKREEWMARSADAGAARACDSVREWSNAAESLCRDSQFELQQQGKAERCYSSLNRSAYFFKCDIMRVRKQDIRCPNKESSSFIYHVCTNCITA